MVYDLPYDSSDEPDSRSEVHRGVGVMARLPGSFLLLACLLASCKKSGGDGGCPGRRDPAPSPLRVVRGPQVAQVTETSLVLAWLSSAPAVGSVEYGTDPSFGSSASGPGGATEHVLSLSGLLPRTLYYYRVLLDGAVASEGHTFLTAPADPAIAIRIAVLGDSGAGNQAQLDVAAGILSANPEVVLITGDVIYDSGCPGEIDPHYFEPYSNLVDHIPFYPALGNHDVLTQRGQPLLDALYLPANDQDGTERYYSFDHGGVHLVALDSNSSLEAGSPQYAWLEADLTQAGATWLFVYFHHPPYSSSRHGSSTGIRASLEPLFNALGVDIVFTGHDHDYERTFPMSGGQVVDAASDPDYVDPGGTIYIVTGGGGRSLYPSGTRFFTAYSESVHHFVQVDVDGMQVTLRAIRDDGTVMDTMTITKSGG